MSNRFFADYKKFIVIPKQDEKFSEKGFDPHEFASHFILTLSIFDPVISSWAEASKHDIDVEKSIENVLDGFNQRNHGVYHLKLLELEKDHTYFVLALSVKDKIDPGQADFEISNIIEKMISNPFYIGQSWYKFTSEKGRVERKLFCFSFKEYALNLVTENS
jgi:hypothetical protein